MHNEIEESIRKNLIIHLSHHSCKICYKPYSDSTIIEPDDLAFIFAEKMFYKLDCTVSFNISSMKKNVRYGSSVGSTLPRKTFSLLKPLMSGDISRFAVTCINCWNTAFLEFNLDKLRGSKCFLKSYK